jgi:hypothetical protein
VFHSNVLFCLDLPLKAYFINFILCPFCFVLILFARHPSTYLSIGLLYCYSIVSKLYLFRLIAICVIVGLVVVVTEIN